MAKDKQNKTSASKPSSAPRKAKNRAERILIKERNALENSTSDMMVFDQALLHRVKLGETLAWHNQRIERANLLRNAGCVLATLFKLLKLWRLLWLHQHERKC